MVHKGTDESTLGKDSSVPLMHHDPSDLGSLILVKKRKIRLGLKNPDSDFPKKRILSFLVSNDKHKDCVTNYALPLSHKL